MTCQIIQADALTALADMPDESVQCVVTSPPYWGLRDYGVDGQLGLEATPGEYVAKMVEIFREVRRVLRGDGTLWLNLGDSYCGSGPGQNRNGSTLQGSTHTQNESKKARASYRRDKRDVGDTPHKSTPGLKPKDLVGIPWRVAFALQADGWYLRKDIIWEKPNPMPESCKDRPTSAHEYLFLLSKSQRYYYNAEAVKEPDLCSQHDRPTSRRDRPTSHVPNASPHSSGLRRESDKNGQGRNRRSVWTIATQGFTTEMCKACKRIYSGRNFRRLQIIEETRICKCGSSGAWASHYAVYPEKLVEPCILAGSRPGDTILDPFNGVGTTGLVALKKLRSYIGIDLNPESIAMTHWRLAPVLAQPDMVNIILNEQENSK